MSKALFVPLQLSLGTAVCLSANPLCAQVTPDGTVNTQVNQNGNVAEITGGETRNGNLFHSFQDFSVTTNNRAFFNNANDISNIFSRVTGGNISTIDGVIQANGSASLFLINPAGIIFGENASLDLGGSFYGSTADSILFEGGEFSAVDNLEQPILTVNAPIGLGFRDEPGDIINRSTVNSVGLQIAPERTIGLIGGDIKLEGGLITAPGGRVELGGFSKAGTISLDENIGFSFPEAVERADISLSEQAAVNVSAGGGGFINVNGRNVTLSEQSELFAGIAENMGSQNAQAGDITINATESVRLLGQPRQNILPDSIGDRSNEAQITEITARDNATGIRNNVGLSGVRRNDVTTPSNAIGSGGNIEINTQTLELSNLTVIDASVFGQGNGGNITVNASEVTSDQGILSTEVRGIDTDTLQEQGRGDAGDISINTQSLSLANASLIFTNIRSEEGGNGGDVNIEVSDTFIQNTDSFILTQLGRNSRGSAGDINITAGSYEIGKRGTLPQEGSLPALQSDSQPDAQGDAGNISIDVENKFSMDGNLILSQVQAGAEGTGGDITIIAGSFEASDGSLILADTKGIGNAGNIKITTADNISLSNNSEISSIVRGNGVGNGGIISLTTDNGIISLFNDAKILSQVNDNARGNGGNVILTSAELNLIDNSRIIADTTGTSPNENDISTAGNINIDVSGDINLDNGNQIQSQTRGGAVGNAGNITIEADGSLFSTNGNLILADSQAKGNGGNITIDAGEQIKLEGTTEKGFASQIVVGLSRESSNGTGGDIKIEATELILEDVAFISSRTNPNSIGGAGNIVLDVNNLSISENAFIDVLTANDFDGGTVTINAQTLDLASGGKILAATDDGGNAGDINLNISEQIKIDNSIQSAAKSEDFKDNQLLSDLLGFPSGIYANTTANSTGNGGNVDIGFSSEVAPQEFIISNDGQIVVDSEGTGIGGNIFLRSQALELNDGSISASTQAGQNNSNTLQSGSITLEIADNLTLKNNSLISAQAFNDADGGNLTIDTNLLVAFPNKTSGNGNDIIASAVDGNGGNINITAESLLGIQAGTALTGNETNDIDASSEFGLDGTISIFTPDINPIQAATELQANIVEPEQTVTQTCQANRQSVAENTLNITGKGGVPIAPGLLLDSHNIIVNDKPSNSTSNVTTPIETSQGKIQPARGIKVTKSGEIILTAYRTNNSGERLPEIKQNCG